MSFTPKTTLEKILCGVTATAKTRLEKAFAAAMLRLSNDPVTVTGTLGQNESEKTTITLNKNAKEVYDAVADGKTVKTSIPVSAGVTKELNCAFAAVKQDSSGTVTYALYAVGADGKQYSASSLAATDTVVLTEA